MTLVAVQCRLSSTRLPGKALLPLGGKTVLDWCLASMKKVSADEYYVATDEASKAELAPIAERNGFKIFAGSLEDVLDRYCSLIGKTKADVVVRATADNPFLFYEASQALLDEYISRYEKEKCDYITWTGLPHGSGIEIFNAKSLLKARTFTNIPYDHEHVGPSLYNHPENFTSLFLPAPAEWNHPELRTTIDTAFDYRRALRIVRRISGDRICDQPYTAAQILKVFDNDEISRPVLYVPCVSKGHGTGHLQRCLSLAISNCSDIYISDEAEFQQVSTVLQQGNQRGLFDWQITRELPKKNEYSLIVTDAFSIDKKLMRSLAECAPVVAIDEGSQNVSYADYLLDVIPAVENDRFVNLSDSSYILLPKNVRKVSKANNPDEFKNILVCAGGEDPADLVVPVSKVCAQLGRHVASIVRNVDEAKKRLTEEENRFVYFMEPVPELRETLYTYDLVITHYGLTAFEAVAAGCAVLLLGTSELHLKLAKKYGFVCLAKDQINAVEMGRVLCHVDELYPQKIVDSQNDLSAYVKKLSKGRRFSCPVCNGNGSTIDDEVLARTAMRTFRRCASCGMQYMAWTIDEENTDYNQSYFFDDYKKQYGKTYLEDFESIKAQCVRRCAEVEKVLNKTVSENHPTVLDIGCAFGPYLSAAKDSGWNVYGTDVSQEAVDYVKTKLNFIAAKSHFPDFDSVGQLGIQSFDAVTMWYVIEHFQDLDSVLKMVSKLVKKGGVFAFSTPSAGGVSAMFNKQSFYMYSPKDHYTLWEPKKAASILKRYGFKVDRIVVTGHHPERFPGMADAKKGSFKYNLYGAASRFFGLGDTFEVYCKKEKDVF